MIYDFFYYLLTFLVMCIIINYTILYLPKDAVLGCILIAYLLELILNVLYHYKVSKLGK